MFQGWLEKDERREEEEEGDADDDDELDADEEYLTRADRFEASYNFRFQVRFTGGVGAPFSTPSSADTGSRSVQCVTLFCHWIASSCQQVRLGAELPAGQFDQGSRG